MKRFLIYLVCFSIFFDVYPQSSSNEEIDEYSNDYNEDIKFGVFQLEEAPVIFNLDDKFKFIIGPYAREIMTEGWGNNPAAVSDVIGMIIPDTTSSPIYLNKGYIVSFQEIGHVVDKDGNKFNLKDIIDENQINKYGERIKWAWEPNYDKSNHILSLPLVYESKDNIDLVHQVKIFGRNGVITLQSLNDIQDGHWLYDNYKEILSGISFTKGNTYSDYSSSNDKIAYSSIKDFIADKPASGLQSVKGNFDIEYDSIRIMGYVAIVLIGIMLFLMSLVWITKPKEETQKDILKLSSNVLLRTGVFYTVYLLILLLSLFLIWLGVEITIAVVTHIFSIKILIAIVIGWFMLIGFLLSVILSLFGRKKVENKYQIQISEEEAPELFSLIKETAEKTGEKMPEKVFITPEMNASVFYKRSLIGILFSGAKNINIGIGLLYGLSKDELRAVLAHEFGHFGQKSMRMGQIVSKSNSVISNLMESGASIVKPVLKWTFYMSKRDI